MTTCPKCNEDILSMPTHYCPSPRTASCPSDAATCSVALRVTGMDKLAIHEAIEATHPCLAETPESYQADALAMELIHKRHDKREIVNLIRWCLMGCPPNS